MPRNVSIRPAVLGAMREGEITTGPEICAAIGMPRNSVWRQLQLLVRDGLVEALDERDEERKRNRHLPQRYRLLAAPERCAVTFAALEQHWPINIGALQCHCTS